MDSSSFSAKRELMLQLHHNNRARQGSVRVIEALSPDIVAVYVGFVSGGRLHVYCLASSTYLVAKEVSIAQLLTVQKNRRQLTNRYT